MNSTSASPRRSAAREMHALILAGGFGRRLEPLTRRLFGEAVPKQFCRFGGERSLLQRTIDRLAPLAPATRVTVVVDQSQAERARSQLARYDGLTLIEQPCDRGTAAGVLLPLTDLVARAPEAMVLLAASDHGIAGESAFLSTLESARSAVRASSERIVLIAAEPDAATMDYGWIVRRGIAEGCSTPDAVVRFVEKPGSAEASVLFASGCAVWNTMLLVANARTLLARFTQQLPELTREFAALIHRNAGVRGIERADYATLPAANFSADVLGPASGLSVLTLPASAGWTDLGTEARMRDWLATKGGVRPQFAEAS